MFMTGDTTHYSKAETDAITTNNNVSHPSHYTDGNIEVIDFITDKFDTKSFCLGNAIKYISRAGKKSNEVEDLRKAIWYINHYIDTIKGDKSND